jgi:multidrug efflux system outer membrane protein
MMLLPPRLPIPFDLPARLRRVLPPFAAVLALPALAGCILTADKLDPALDIPASYQGPHGPAGAALPKLDWWRGFNARELTELIEEAQVANLDIAVAVARIVQADAQARIAGAALLPVLTGNASDTRARSSTAVSSSGGAAGLGGVSAPDRTTYSASLSASYEIDFWGKNRAAVRAADQSAIGSRFDREVTTLSTVATVANTYFLVVSAQDRVRIARNNVASAERILTVIRDRFNAGTAAALDVAQQETLVASQRATIPPLVIQELQNKQALALLVGRPPERLAVRGGAMSRIRIPRVTPGLPSELLTQRPDIRAAEARLAGADANVESARAAFFPSIQLTGEGGFQSAALRSLFGPGAAFYSLAAGLTQPILDGNRLLGQLDQQKGVRDELIETYRKTVVQAFTDVDQALVAVAQTAEQERLQREAVATAQRAFDLSEERLRGGTIDLTTLLQVQQTLFQQQDALAQVRLSRMQAIVSLYQALGGGFPQTAGLRTAER